MGRGMQWIYNVVDVVVSKSVNSMCGICVLTLLLFWQHVDLMHPSSVVGQSRAQQSCEPLMLSVVEIPSAKITTIF